MTTETTLIPAVRAVVASMGADGTDGTVWHNELQDNDPGLLAALVKLRADLAEFDRTFHVESATPPAPRNAVQIPHMVLPDEFFDSVLCTAIESADYGWFDWADIVQGRDPELPSVPTYVSGICTEYDPEEGTPMEGAEPVLVDYAKLTEGIQKIVDGTVPVGTVYRASLIEAVRNADAGMIDADLADCIVQAAVLGEIRYG